MADRPEPAAPREPIRATAFTRVQLFAAFFFAVLFFLLFQLYRVLSPFAGVLFLAGMLVIIFSPLTARVLRRTRGSRTAAAAVMTAGTVLLVLLPLGTIITLLVGEAVQVVAQIEELRQSGRADSIELVRWTQDAWDALQQRFPPLASVDVSSVGLQASQRVATFVATQGQSLVTGVAVTLLDAGMMVLAMFFFFRDGDRIASLLRELIPMHDEYKDRILKILYDTVQAVVQATFAIALIQGVIAGLGYAVLGGLSVSVFLAFLTAVASLIPVLGATLVWLPTALYVLFGVEVWRGLALLVWGVAAVGTVDNIVRPVLIGGRVQIPTVLLLFAILGGVRVYGVLGIFVAPVLVAILLGFLGIYRERLALLK